MIHNTEIKELLVRLSHDNCDKAYKSLFLLLYPRLLEFSNAIIKSKEDAEEVVSDFFIKVWQKRDIFASIENPKLYCFVSVKNLSINRLQVNKKLIAPQLEDWDTNISSVFFNPEELMISKEAVSNIMTSVNKLPPKCKTIFKMVKEEGLKYNEVAKLLDISPKTVEAQMAIALRRIRNCTDFKNEFPFVHSLLTKNK
ncbi:MAG: RNA polymerase sigma-70 factor [Chitinophagia bacterium]|jgi:RNA polymerase sigma-70 factor (family 1)